MVLKALGGSEGKGSPESVIEAIKYAEANGADICNLSFGSSNCTPEFEAAIRDSKMLFVVAAGNGNQYQIGYEDVYKRQDLRSYESTDTIADEDQSVVTVVELGTEDHTYHWRKYY